MTSAWRLQAATLGEQPDAHEHIPPRERAELTTPKVFTLQDFPQTMQSASNLHREALDSDLAYVEHAKRARVGG